VTSWVQKLVMVVVIGVWSTYMLSATFDSGEVPSPFVWTIPGGTYALLTGRVPTFWRQSSSESEKEKP
jgi:hypothetical protein